ncbi:MAG: hypothetical protein WC813_00105 [Patescibacteria group bacterium]|jgi:hypothetical protein
MPTYTCRKCEDASKYIGIPPSSWNLAHTVFGLIMVGAVIWDLVFLRGSFFLPVVASLILTPIFSITAISVVAKAGIIGVMTAIFATSVQGVMLLPRFYRAHIRGAHTVQTLSDGTLHVHLYDPKFTNEDRGPRWAVSVGGIEQIMELWGGYEGYAFISTGVVNRWEPPKLRFTGSANGIHHGTTTIKDWLGGTITVPCKYPAVAPELFAVVARCGSVREALGTVNQAEKLLANCRPSESGYRNFEGVYTYLDRSTSLDALIERDLPKIASERKQLATIMELAVRLFNAASEKPLKNEFDRTMETVQRYIMDTSRPNEIIQIIEHALPEISSERQRQQAIINNLDGLGMAILGLIRWLEDSKLAVRSKNFEAIRVKLEGALTNVDPERVRRWHKRLETEKPSLVSVGAK